jgi:hypothetical protein
MTDYDDAAAAAFYADPDNRSTTGESAAGPTNRLSAHVPIRFSPSMISGVKRAADEDGMTVSSWIRAIVERELRHRYARDSHTGHEGTQSVHVRRYRGTDPRPLTGKLVDA